MRREDRFIEEEMFEARVSRLLASIRANGKVTTLLKAQGAMEHINWLENWFESNRS